MMTWTKVVSVFGERQIRFRCLLLVVDKICYSNDVNYKKREKSKMTI